MSHYYIYARAYFFTILASHLFFFSISATEFQPFIVREEFLSPLWNQHDCHSSSLVEISPGILLAAWKGGEGEGQCNKDMIKNVGIWIAHLKDNKWTEPSLIVEAKETLCWTPVLAKLPDGELLLFYRKGSNPRQAISFLTRSSDGGKKWSGEEQLPAGIYGPTKNKPLITENGTLIAGSSIEIGEPSEPYRSTACWIEISKDRGATWEKHGPLEIPGKRFGAIEPALFFDEVGRLSLLCRDRSNKIGGAGYIWRAVSEDGGIHWGPLHSTSLPNPDSGIDAVDLGKGKILLFFNPSHKHRYPLSATLSLDGGKNWGKPITIEEDSGEMPSAIQTIDGLVHLTYAFSPKGHKQRVIKHAVIDPAKLIETID